MKSLLAALLLLVGASGVVHAASALALDVRGASVAPDELTGQPVLKIRLSPEGQEAFAEYTTQHVGRTLDLLVDDEVLTSPTVMAPIYSEWVVVTGTFTTGELEALAEAINGGTGAVTVRVAKIKQAL